MSIDFDTAEADLYEDGCEYSEEVFDCPDEESFRDFVESEGLDPDDYIEPDGEN